MCPPAFLFEMSVHVYAIDHGPITHRPIMHVSRSTAHKWLLWGTHEEIPGALRAIRVVPASRRIRICHLGGGLPEKMPMLELPGLHFEEPRSAAWREVHRMVRFHAGKSAEWMKRATCQTGVGAIVPES